MNSLTKKLIKEERQSESIRIRIEDIEILLDFLENQKGTRF